MGELRARLWGGDLRRDELCRGASLGMAQSSHLFNSASLRESRRDAAVRAHCRVLRAQDFELVTQIIENAGNMKAHGASEPHGGRLRVVADGLRGF